MPVIGGQKKKKIYGITLFWIFLSLLVASRCVNSTKANSGSLGSVSPDSDTKPPVVSIFTPEDHALYAINDISLSIGVAAGESSTASSKYISKIYYKADWQANTTSIYTSYSVHPTGVAIYRKIAGYQGMLNLTDIPDGNHSLTVYAREKGRYYEDIPSPAREIVEMPGYSDFYIPDFYDFEILGSSSVFFTVDTTAPSVSVLSMKDTTFNASDVDLSFAVNEQTSRTAYSIDGNDNVTVVGNTTLAGLPVGVHNVTVYTWDEAGNVGVSETVYFTVTEPFPVTLVVVASVASVAAISMSLLFYFKKRKH